MSIRIGGSRSELPCSIALLLRTRLPLGGLGAGSAALLLRQLAPLVTLGRGRGHRGLRVLLSLGEVFLGGLNAALTLVVTSIRIGRSRSELPCSIALLLRTRLPLGGLGAGSAALLLRQLA